MPTFHRQLLIRRPWLSAVLAISTLLSACGGSGGSASNTATAPAPTLTPTTPSLSAYSGNLFGPGNLDGTGQAARFNSPNAVALDAAGNAYVADSDNAMIRKITPAGVVTTLAGHPSLRGSQDGTGSAATFRKPQGIVVDSQGNLFVSDSEAHTIRKITPAGVVSTFAGQAMEIGTTDGNGTDARFRGPYGIAIDSSDQLYITDQINQRIRKITSAGVVSTFAGQGSVGTTDGIGASALFSYPAGIAVDSSTGVVYVVDQTSHRIRRIDTSANVTTLAGSTFGHADGIGSAARFRNPDGITLINSGLLAVADRSNYRVRLVSTTGQVTTLAGSDSFGHQDGSAAVAKFYFPTGVAYHSASNSIWVADSGSHTIRKLDLLGAASTLAGRPGNIGARDDSIANAEYNLPGGIISDAQGNLLVADTANNSVRLLNTTTNWVSTFAGTVFGDDDGIGTAARFRDPSALTRDAAGNLYVADRFNHTIRKITPAGLVTTLAGTAGTPGYLDGTGSAVYFGYPSGIVADSTGHLFVTDYANNTIRKVTPAGVVTTFAGTAGSGGTIDGTGSAARFEGPSGIAIDASNNLYVTDDLFQNIRKITPAGVVTTLAGGVDVSGSTDGVGAAARFANPRGIAVDSLGNVYVADSANYTIRKITPAGVVSTVVGQAGRFGFTAGALPGVLADAITGLHIQGRTLYITMRSGVAVVNNLP
jgi:sugar lactone lactonase YvrE